MTHPTRSTSPAPAVPDALANFDRLPDSAHVRVPVVVALCACSRSTIWRRVAAGTFPQPRKFGATTAWNVGDLRRHLAATE